MSVLPRVLIILAFVGSILGSGPLQIDPEPDFPLPVGRPEERFDLPNDSYRLPLVVIPERYELTSRPIILEPMDEPEEINEVRFTAPGHVTIYVKAIESTYNITLHAYNLTMRDVKVQELDGTDLVIQGHGYSNLEKDFYTIELSPENPIYFGRDYKILIDYVADVSQLVNVGLYRSYYNINGNPNGELRYLSTTKFEPYHARKAFPAFDEPSLRAKFKITLGMRKNVDGGPVYKTLTNYQNVTETQNDQLPNWIWIEHEESAVTMSTYQVTMIISDFENTLATNEAAVQFGKPVQVWAPPHLISQGSGQYSADLIAGILLFYQQKFGMDYHLPKMDTVAVPTFPSGAMEQWGLNTYRAEYLLYNPRFNSHAERRRVSFIVSHELAHQWFGNAVVCQWWSSIWLNEGFATYLSFKAMDHLVPEFDPLNRFFIDATTIAMKFDQGPSTHPIYNNVQVPTDISGLFSDINYEKAACIIRMVENVFGGFDPLVEGLKHYLDQMELDAAEQNDLFLALQTRNPPLPDITVKEFLDTWTIQSGYPLIRVTSGAYDRIYISQEKFIFDPKVRQEYFERQGSTLDLDPKDMWHIPIAISTTNTDSSKSPKIWLKKNQVTISYGTDIDTREWLIVNPEAAAYCRVMYEDSMRNLILEQLTTDSDAFKPITRAQLIDDHFNFALADYIPIESALDFTQYLDNETELIGWTVTWDHLRTPFLRFNDNQTEADIFSAYVRPRISGALDLIGLKHNEEEIGTEVILRAILLDYASAMGHQETWNYGNELYLNWTNSGTNFVPLDYQAVIYCSAIRHNDLAHDFLYFEYQSERRPENSAHRLRLLNSLGCTKNTFKLQRLLLDAFNTSDVMDVDRVAMFQAVAGSREGRALVIDFVKLNYGRGPLAPEAVVNIFSTMSTLVSDPVTIQTLRDFVNNVADSSTRPALNGHLATMEANANWRETVGQRMLQWFQNMS